MLSNKLKLVNKDLTVYEKPLSKIAYVSEPYLMKDNRGKINAWSFLIYKVKKNTQGNILTGENILDIKDIKETIHDDIYIVYVMGLIDSPTYPRMSKPKKTTKKNVNKKNEINEIESAIVIGEAERNLKIRKKNYIHYSKFDLNKKNSFELINNSIDNAPVPEQFKAKFNYNFSKKLFIQLKRDGVSLICCYHPAFVNHKYNIIAYTRNRKLAVGFEDIKEQLLPFLKTKPGLFVIGEIYEHGMKHEMINSIHSKNVQGSLLKANIPYYVFDCFYTGLSKIKFEVGNVDIIFEAYNETIKFRNSVEMKTLDPSIEEYNKYIKKMEIVVDYFINLKKTLSNLEGGSEHLLFSQRKKILAKLEETKLVKLVNTWELVNQEELDYFNTLLDEDNTKYEGFIIRQDSAYKYSFGGEKRNPTSFKLKEFDDDEFEIVDYKTGQGNAKQTIMFKLKVGDKFFYTAMNLPDDEQLKLYKEVTKDFSKFKGKKLTVKYFGFTKDKIPRFPRGLRFRD